MHLGLFDDLSNFSLWHVYTTCLLLFRREGSFECLFIRKVSLNCLQAIYWTFFQCFFRRVFWKVHGLNVYSTMLECIVYSTGSECIQCDPWTLHVQCIQYETWMHTVWGLNVYSMRPPLHVYCMRLACGVALLAYKSCCCLLDRKMLLAVPSTSFGT